MEKRFDISPRQGYINKVTDLMNSGTIPVGNSHILHRLALGKTASGEIIEDWGAHKNGTDTADNCILCVTTAKI